MHPESIDSRPTPGEAIQLEPGLRVILADNPSPMTHWGTNTYLLGTEELLVIDPGPNDTAHLTAIMRAIGPAKLAKIVVTHAHLDHSPLSKALKEKTNAEIYAFGDALSGRSKIMDQLAKSGLMGGGEGLDLAFQPDHLLAHNDTIDFGNETLRVLHTPGHLGNHISLAWNDVCFTGDHIMGWASSLVSPPDGDLTDFMRSCDLLAESPWRVFYAGHGAPITNPKERLEWLIAHRKSREAEILTLLAQQPATAADLAETIYIDVNPKLLGAATRNVLAHLVDLYGRNLVRPQQQFDSKAIFELI
ncbi:MBL fold metallo-hydrolase [Cognatishimia sp. 1_MG-2023]|uniref:MBL fold metallo-hydrolase n=1 Tax=Cognatishimia sp. 1_MG-2023 TaxID=3062642 RepID=UPI0026E1B9E9|nr:MBL fold metallo-hydrolase [Cognatishimia sp. 1_MG-2023]MDO6725332.1 MBL fold metallo-hydrolase [Cognatishimia sp. 1_MG-2023]